MRVKEAINEKIIFLLFYLQFLHTSGHHVTFRKSEVEKRKMKTGNHQENKEIKLKLRLISKSRKLWSVLNLSNLLVLW